MKSKCVLAIWLDGFRHDYLREDKTPFLYNLYKTSTSGKYKPLLAFTGIGVSMLTGVSPLTHGIWVDFCRDYENSPFKWVNRIPYILRLIDDLTFSRSRKYLHWIKLGSTHVLLKVLNKCLGRTFLPLALSTPFRALPYFNTALPDDISLTNALPVPTIISILRKANISAKFLTRSRMKDAQIIKESMALNDGVRLVFIQLGELDEKGHKYGPQSEEVLISLQHIDSVVNKLVMTYKNKCELTTFIFTDHGMVEVKNVINLWDILRSSKLKNGKDYLVFLNSSIAQFWFSNREAKETIVSLLAKIKDGKWLSTEDLNYYQVPNEKRYGEAIWLANRGCLIIPNYYQGFNQVRGMHGYAPEVEDLHSPFIIHGDNIKSHEVHHLASPMDIFPTILDLLSIPIPEYVEGHSLLKVN